MDIQAYISSGIIESYVMGMATPKERAEFESLCKEHPEIQEARDNFEKSLEKKAFANAIEPPSYLKQQVIDVIQQEKALTSNKIVGIRSRGMRWAVAASIILLLGCSLFVYIMYQKNQELKQDLAVSKDTMNKLEEKRRLLLDQNSSPQAKKVNLVDKKRNVIAAINVFWDSTSTDVYLVIKDLAPLSPPQQYQLWAVTNGNYKSLGMFNAPDNDKLILKMNNVKEADAFAITIEDKTKNGEPLLETVPAEKF